jgi:ribosomal protein L10
MAINKDQKKSLVKQYVQDLQDAKNLIVFKQSGLAVSTDADIRREVREEDGKYNMIRKRLFIRALTEAGYPEVNLENLPGSAVAVYAK